MSCSTHELWCFTDFFFYFFFYLLSPQRYSYGPESQCLQFFWDVGTLKCSHAELNPVCPRTYQKKYLIPQLFWSGFLSIYPQTHWISTYFFSWKRKWSIITGVCHNGMKFSLIQGKNYGGTDERTFKSADNLKNVNSTFNSYNTY